MLSTTDALSCQYQLADLPMMPIYNIGENSVDIYRQYLLLKAAALYCFVLGVCNSKLQLHLWFTKTLILCPVPYDAHLSGTRFFNVWQCWPQRYFERPQLFHLNTEIVTKRLLVYFDRGGKVTFYCTLRDGWKCLRPFRSLKTPQRKHCSSNLK